MSLKERLFGKPQVKPAELPPLFEQEDPVNYGSVLDWLLGLNDRDYDKMQQVVANYREANKNAAHILKVKQNFYTQLIIPQLTDEQIDSSLDQLIETPSKELKAAFESDKKK